MKLKFVFSLLLCVFCLTLPVLAVPQEANSQSLSTAEIQSRQQLLTESIKRNVALLEARDYRGFFKSALPPGSIPEQALTETFLKENTPRLQKLLPFLKDCLGRSAEFQNDYTKAVFSLQVDARTGLQNRRYFYFQTSTWYLDSRPYSEFHAKGNAAYQQKNYAESAKYFKEAISAGVPEAGVFYDASCTMALAGLKEDAFRFLEIAIDEGFDRVRHIANDQDLISLHDDTRWAKIIDHAKKKQEARAKADGVNYELLLMFDEDQGDRLSQHIDWEVVSKRDEAHRKRVQEMLDKGELKVGKDYYHAAFVFQHGSKPEDYDKAHQMALKAIELGYDARWISAATKDRYLWSTGKPQIYGTQSTMRDGKWTMEPIDEKAVTDEERARLGVPSLAQAKAGVEARNRELEKK